LQLGRELLTARQAYFIVLLKKSADGLPWSQAPNGGLNVTTTKMFLLATEDRDLGPVHSTKALARAKQEARTERKTVYVRDELSDEVEYEAHPNGSVTNASREISPPLTSRQLSSGPRLRVRA
jgi:hypothetical protein